MYQERSLDEFRCNSGNEQYSSFCFDAVWALALAINRSLTGEFISDSGNHELMLHFTFHFEVANLTHFI